MNRARTHVVRVTCPGPRGRQRFSTRFPRSPSAVPTSINAGARHEQGTRSRRLMDLLLLLLVRDQCDVTGPLGARNREALAVTRPGEAQNRFLPRDSSQLPGRATVECSEVAPTRIFPSACTAEAKTSPSAPGLGLVSSDWARATPQVASTAHTTAILRVRIQVSGVTASALLALSGALNVEMTRLTRNRSRIRGRRVCFKRLRRRLSLCNVSRG